LIVHVPFEKSVLIESVDMPLRIVKLVLPVFFNVTGNHTVGRSVASIAPNVNVPELMPVPDKLRVLAPPPL
jgi:hypothetical protein